MPNFETFFKALWGYTPFPWQEMLAKRVAEEQWPGAIDLPTASGKTACMDAAIWALAYQADQALAKRTAPRRTWFVVDRRIVVDEAFDRAQRISAKLKEATGGPLKAVADRLLAVGGTSRPLAVARLRGGVLRDDGWARLPSQPALITSTVDQLGSRLLFRGYGRSHLTAPIFAGLAAHDSLILLDEAHCSVPFLQTLRSIQRYRGKDWAEEPIETPFAFSVLSATPPPDIPQEAVFPGVNREAALDHPILQDRMQASKPAVLVPPLKAKKSSTVDALVTEAVNLASDFIGARDKKRVAVIVNRVRTAIHIAAALREQLSDSADTVLLTGRLRPYERDRLVKRWKPFLRAREPEDPSRPIVLVATQTIEVGADFSFDALVSEIASLDALRQRFGRLNRMGSPGPAPGAILARDKDVKDGANDPIYGTSIGATWRFLKARTAGEAPATIDFGIEAFDEVLSEVGDLSPYLAPTAQAPALLPAHLDLLCQTATVAHPEPDIQLYLHGVDRGAPEARVVWRADLRPKNLETWKESVALCPPASGEALAIPLYRLWEWLADMGVEADFGDLEDVPAPPREVIKEGIRPVLVWAGRDRSRLVKKAADLRPNDLIVVPADYGMVPMGQAEPERALGPGCLDLWEVARQASGRPAAVRLHRAVLAPWNECPAVRDLLEVAADPASEGNDLGDAVEAVLAFKEAREDASGGIPKWLKGLLSDARMGRVEQHPDGGLILFQQRSSTKPNEEPDLFADDDDLLSASGKEVSLADHSASVERATRKIAERCLPHDLMKIMSRAAYWHDVGKLDERFQVVLRQGDELAAVAGEPLAKSREIPASPARRRAIREASGLPRDFRHEMLSFQIAERFVGLPEERERADLLLHLIASHHGHGRPWAPVCIDPDPPGIRAVHGGVQVELGTEDRRNLNPPHAISSGIGDRFWRLNRRYGWWGLAYLEAILRLGDWYGSQHIMDASDVWPLSSMTACSAGVLGKPAVPIVLPGINGANPLGFLAGLGVLNVLHAAGESEAKLHWERSATWQLVITGIAPDGPVDFAKQSCGNLEGAVATVVAEALRGDDVPEEAEKQRKKAQKRYEAAGKATKEKERELKDRGLRGKERKIAIEAEVTPLQLQEARCRAEWQAALRQATPRPELAIGQHIDCSLDEFHEIVVAFLDGAGLARREALDFLASFVSDANLHESGTKRANKILASTPFCFISGSGHQYFLDTVRQLIAKVNDERVRSVLFDSWRYRDEKLSMRWDPSEDRRYALMDRDPTASDNKSRTVWMANLLAYRGLVLFPSMPRRGHLGTTAWRHMDSEPVFTWPIWTDPAGPETIRSLLLLPELLGQKPDPQSLRQRGVVSAFRSRRIKVGSGTNYKVNFSSAACVL